MELAASRVCNRRSTHRCGLYAIAEHSALESCQRPQGPHAAYILLLSRHANASSLSPPGKSSLKPEDAVADYSTLEPAEMKVLDQWYDFFSKVGLGCRRWVFFRVRVLTSGVEVQCCWQGCAVARYI